MSNVPQHSVYVRSEDRELWDWAQAYARAHRWTTSAVVMIALERLREEIQRQSHDPGKGGPAAPESGTH